MQQKSPLLHPGKGGNADVLALVGQLAVNLVANDKEVLVDGETRKTFQFFTIGRTACGIGRKVE